MSEVSKGKRFPSFLIWIALLLCTAASFFVVLFPVKVIMPFSYQAPDQLDMAMKLRAWSPTLTIILFVLLIALTVILWKRSRRWFGKIPLVLVFLINLAPVWFAQQNHFEWMFNPLPNAQYSNVVETDFVGETDKVIAIEINEDAVAYPVLQIAYHHIVNDVVGGTPIVATY
jgi:hypothetical protein